MGVWPAVTVRPRLRPLSLSLLFGLAAALLAWVFVHLGSEMAEGDTRAVDLAILHVMHVVTLCTAITVGYLALVSVRRMAGLVAVAVITGAVGISLLKVTYGRVRPGAAFADVVVAGMSFPSWHAGMSAIVFLTLGALLASTRSRAVKRTYIIAVAAFLAMLLGLSRVALGVYWATDVLAGWAYGFGWALFWLLLARAAVGGGQEESDPDGMAQSSQSGVVRTGAVGSPSHRQTRPLGSV
jgi:undecaprenyl-diphosphatase